MTQWYDSGTFSSTYGWDIVEASPPPRQTDLLLRDREIAPGAWAINTDGVDTSPGRRLRVFATLISREYGRDTYTLATKTCPDIDGRKWRYGELLEAILDGQFDAPHLAALPLRSVDTRITEIPLMTRTSDPELPHALQDLGDEINEDIREALFTLDSPSHYYPGVDEGIEPVPDDHVALVIWALQRELNRELRALTGMTAKLPAAPLASLSPAVQRALAERRRLRYSQYGIGREQWQANTWSLWAVRDDPEWVSRRASRLKPA